MPKPTFRFLHASDLHLGQVASGVDRPADALADLLVDCTYRAAERLFDIALREEVDFVVLTGDVIDPTVAGIRGVLFLQQQLERLAESGISVYWGTTDDESWPEQVALPDAVVRLTPGESGHCSATPDKLPQVWLTAVDRSGVVSQRAVSRSGDVDKTYTVALRSRPINSLERMAAEDSGVDYWAFGGSHRRRTLFASKHTAAHVAGSHQGLDPSETDAHGATIVSVDQEHQSRLWFVPTDALRWRSETIDAADADTLDDVERKLTERARQLAADVTAVDLAVTWQLNVPLRLYGAASRPDWLRELAERLNQRLAVTSPAAWTVAAEVVTPAELPPHWRERDDLCGEMLREADTLRSDRSLPIGIEAAIDTSGNVTSSDEAEGETSSVRELSDEQYLRGFLRLEDAHERRRLLDEAIVLGTSWLEAEEAQS
ncbi:MAG: metallophosphoesterase [Pirellulales bacterium]